ncbi:MAG: polysaccharide biosynthesis/export family protein [Limisphaerales bacterium]
MNLELHQHIFGRRVIQRVAPHDGVIAWIRAPVLFVALAWLLGTTSLFADDLFLNLPIQEPTNNSPAVTTAHATPLKAAPSTPSTASGAFAPATNGMAALDNQYELAIGDSISFQIQEDEDNPTTLTVMDSGDLEIPYIGLYPAAGKTCKQLAFQLKAALEKQYYYRATVLISVDVKAKTRGKVYLTGAVGAPGPQEIPNDEPFSLSKAVMRAGGFTDFADGRHVQVTRSLPNGEVKTYIVNVEQVLQDGKIDSDMKLEPGDLIYVPEKLVHF